MPESAHGDQAFSGFDLFTVAEVGILEVLRPEVNNVASDVLLFRIVPPYPHVFTSHGNLRRRHLPRQLTSNYQC